MIRITWKSKTPSLTDQQSRLVDDILTKVEQLKDVHAELKTQEEANNKAILLLNDENRVIHAALKKNENLTEGLSGILFNNK